MEATPAVTFEEANPPENKGPHVDLKKKIESIDYEIINAMMKSTNVSQIQGKKERVKVRTKTRTRRVARTKSTAKKVRK